MKKTLFVVTLQYIEICFILLNAMVIKCLFELLYYKCAIN